MANTYTFHGPGERWVVEDATAEDFMNVSRENADHLHEALNTIMDTDAADGVLIGTFTTLSSTLVDVAAATVKVVITSEWDPASGTPLDGQGLRWQAKMSDDANNQDVVGAMDWIETDVSAATEDADWALSLISGGSLTERMRMLSSGMLGIGETSNADMTVGETTNLGTNDDQASAWKSDDVAHDMTDLVETNTFTSLSKLSAANGGVIFQSWGQGTAGMFHRAHVTTQITTDTTASGAAVVLEAALKTSNTATILGATGNIQAFSNFGVTRVLFKGDGTVHASDTTWATPLDAMPDALAARAYITEMAHRQGLGLLGGMEVHAPDLVRRMEDAGIVTRAELPGEGHVPGHRFLNIQKSIKFSWDMGFQQMDYIGELMKVLPAEQIDALPKTMKSHFAMLEQHKAIEIKLMEN